MNEYDHILGFHKINAFRDAVHNSVGGKENYFRVEERIDFDPYTILGQKTKGGENHRKGLSCHAGNLERTSYHWK